jgi:hypothetical protein
MVEIAQAGNTHYPALGLLRKKGYRLRTTYSEQREISYFTAYKDGRDFIAGTGDALLGIVCLWEECGADWQKAGTDFDFDEFETYSEDDEGVITSVIEDENGTRTETS